MLCLIGEPSFKRDEERKMKRTGIWNEGRPAFQGMASRVIAKQRAAFLSKRFCFKDSCTKDKRLKGSLEYSSKDALDYGLA
ncbi:hypothetical protein T265_11180 [Opisthorchis viverrini]|uniref:Uncharacterized protein n=1 Tax=Opisthorchis viverrini TaxID=6198 RepID=A0A074Z3Y3_OPIVI|nr:hypothetical protein T265_11180 [Opisthorchis viverrini]KER20207.1 hypothetical protein T265_11180 [Opisthorchis viverrini]